MRILITNDDGIDSPVLPRLIKWAEKHGDVTTVAPKFEQSGKSQGIEIHNEVEVKKVELKDGIWVYSMDSTPADCVRFGVLGLNKGYDLVISGINRGFNVGNDIAYSGTVAGIFEASRLGINGLALSTDYRSFDDAMDKLDEVWDFISQNKQLFEINGLYNVNIPLNARGIRITHQGGMYFSDAFEHRVGDMYIQVGSPVDSDVENPNSDINAVCSGFTSITPLTAHKTHLEAYKALQKLK